MKNTAAQLNEETVIRFEEGIIGVPRARNFELLEREDSPVWLLRCLDIEGFTLPVVDPRLVDPEYTPKIARHISASLESSQEEPLLFLAVTALGKSGAVANLKAPVVVNVARRAAIQVILDGDYPLRAPVELAGDR